MLTGAREERSGRSTGERDDGSAEDGMAGRAGRARGSMRESELPHGAEVSAQWSVSAQQVVGGERRFDCPAS